MPIKRSNVFHIGVGPVLSFSLLLACLPTKTCLALISSRKPSLQTAGYEKLTTGDGPTTNDAAAMPVAQPHGQIESNNLSLPDELRPMTLHDQETNNQDGNSQSNNQAGNNETSTLVDSASVLKSEVSTTDYVPKQGDNRVMQPKSVKDDSKSLVKQASKVGLGPLQLVESQEETGKKVDAILTAEQMELSDLWEATLARSPDIQFVVQKLQPTSNPAHLSTILTRLLSTAAFGGLGAAAMVSPNPGMYAATSAGGSMIQQVLGMKEKSDAKRAKLSQEEELVMFKMVRDTCDRLVDSFRDYKKSFAGLNRATSDLVDLKSMVADARVGQDSAKQLEMEYTLRKQQRDIDGVAEDVRRYRLTLIDLAGPEAIDKLDKQLAEEQNKIAQGANMNVSSVADPQATTADSQAGSAEEPKTAQKTNGASGEIQIDQCSIEKQEPKQTASNNPSPQS